MSARRPADYAELVRELFPRLTGGVRWGLERTRALLEHVGDPHESYPAIHIGGTNGKGSVATTAESILRAGGLRTGLYTSPHLISFRERIRIDGQPIPEQQLLDVARELWPAVVREQPSFFEATTALAFRAMQRAGVDVAVVEVGLGGRLDSTNVLNRPRACVITNVSLDHMDLLGDDLAAIAAEKAGIAKKDVPLLTAERGPVALAVLRERCQAAGAPLVRLDPASIVRVRTTQQQTQFDLRSGHGPPLELHSPLIGTYQPVNVALAIRAVELSGLLRESGGGDDARSAHAIRAGVAATRWPGRMQTETIAGATWLFDVAHNAAAVDGLLASLEELAFPRPWRFVAGILRDKEWPRMLKALAAVADELVLTSPASAPAERVWDLSAAAAVADHMRARVRVLPTLTAAIASIAERADGTRVVTGSFHTVGEALTGLGVPLGWAADPDPAAA